MFEKLFEKFKPRKNGKFVSVGIAVVLLLLVAIPAFAAFDNNQAIEIDNGGWNSSKPTFTLSYVGYVQGCQKDQTDKDYKYRINFGKYYGPFNPDRFRLKVSSSTATWAINKYGNGTLSGYNLLDRNSAYLCIGSKSNLAGANQNTVKVYEQ